MSDDSYMLNANITGRLLHDTTVEADEEASTHNKDVLTPEEKSRRRWLTDSPRQLAARIPNSVFALGGPSATEQLA
jgi:hypothetical protein